MRRPAFAALALLLTAAPACAADVIDCTGLFHRDTTHAALVQAFGEKNVTFGEIIGAEAATETATVLFPRNAKRRLEVMWHDPDARARPARIRMHHGSVWVAPGPVKLGDAFATVEKLNGVKLTLEDVEWEYQGMINQWKDGAFDRLPGGCKLWVFLKLPLGHPRDPAFRNPTEAKLRARNPKVIEIVVAYDAPEN